LLLLLASFIFISTRDNLFSSKLIYFLAILKINRKIKWLRIVKSYLYILASVIYYIRVITIERLLLSI
ncbi:hypothetical protein K458DRAFT_313719, partial [Lentithecium fluviatile CBS 122367]